MSTVEKLSIIAQLLNHFIQLIYDSASAVLIFNKNVDPSQAFIHVRFWNCSISNKEIAYSINISLQNYVLQSHRSRIRRKISFCI